MPNHCFNEVKAKKEILDEIYDYEKEKITFNKLIPFKKDFKIPYHLLQLHNCLLHILCL